MIWVPVSAHERLNSKILSKFPQFLPPKLYIYNMYKQHNLVMVYGAYVSLLLDSLCNDLTCVRGWSWPSADYSFCQIWPSFIKFDGKNNPPPPQHTHTHTHTHTRRESWWACRNVESIRVNLERSWMHRAHHTYMTEYLSTWLYSKYAHAYIYKNKNKDV